MKRTATAQWKGDATTGKGDLNTQSGALTNQPYSFNTRFESEDGKAGTNPEELLAAAHAGCFTMALSFVLAGAGFTAETLKTEAVVEVQKQDSGFAVTHIQLNLIASVPNIEEKTFLEHAETAKKNCPLSKALAQVPISLNAKLEAST